MLKHSLIYAVKKFYSSKTNQQLKTKKIQQQQKNTQHHTKKVDFISPIYDLDSS